MKKDKLHNDKGGFKVPEDYFTSFEEKLSQAISSENSEESILDTLKSTGDKVPKGYFDAVEEEILQKTIGVQPKSKVIALFSKRNILFVSGIAAMIAIIISLSINTESKINFDDIDIADIQTYFDDGNIELSDQEMASLLGEEHNYTETFEDELVDDDDLLEYLSEEDNIEDEIIFVD
ncbi:hypothetical protein [Aquimarina sp. AU474]|uniref:hypothetical protein n=1 Tax=Aquimarina sp. AU474 TaxID=2108529 RepID=UPI000D68EDE5|nr:hypothetical protein [Aquimarina sp. AU474]